MARYPYSARIRIEPAKKKTLPFAGLSSEPATEGCG
jgi:hypothetical protein